MWLFTALVLLLSVLFIVFYHRFNRSTRLMNKIPGPKSWPIIGNSYNFLLPPEKLFLYQRHLTKVYGDVSQIHGFNVRMVNISNPADVEKILSSSEYNNKEHPYSYFKGWLGSGLLLSNGSKWHQRRKMLTKAFHFNILKKFMMTFVDETEYFLKTIQREEVAKEKTSVMPLVSSAMLRILCETTMGNNSHEGIQLSTDPYIESIHVIGDTGTKRISRPWLHSDDIFQLTNIAKEQNDAIQIVHKFTNTVIQERREYLTKNLNQFEEHDDRYEGSKKLALLDMLLKYEKDGLINSEGIREEIDTFMFAGHDTTSIAMSFILLVLANKLEVQDKLYDEIYNIFGDSDRSPTAEDLSAMQYMDCVIKETLRLYPIVPMIVRFLTKETVLGGYTIPANTSIFIYIYDMMRRPEVFPEPDRFKPERFLPENCAQRHPYAYVPFSAGPRNCIGQKFALLELKTMMTGLLRKYRLEPVTKLSDLVYKTDIVLRTTHPIYVKFSLRK